MRNRNLFGLAILLSIILIFATNFIFPLFAPDSGFVFSRTSPLVSSFIIAPILMIILVPLNNRLRKWRKDHGRDIEEEERYETEYGMTRLTPNDDSSTKD